MDSENDKKDNRILCKYGSKCYQKNPVHHNKYKHPPNSEMKGDMQPNKKIKIQTGDKEIKEVNIFEKKDDDENQGEPSRNKVNFFSNGQNSANTISEDTKIEIENHSNGTITSLKPREFIKAKFLVEMPEDFYQFYEFCKHLKANAPLQGLNDVGLTLVGPYDVLAGKFTKDLPEEQYLVHWRYFRDPPELQTVLKGDDKSGYHIGYFRDDPNELPVFLVSNSANQNGVLMTMGDNIFAAVNIYLENLKKTGDPFKKMHISRIQAALKKKASELKLDLSEKTDRMVQREKKIVVRTFNKVGLVVPYNRKTKIGYRELALDNKSLRALLAKLDGALPEQKDKYLSELQPVFTYASIAADECDFGTSIELGWDILAHGTDRLNSTVAQFLGTGYRLLKRDVFARIAEAHMKERKKGGRLSVVE